MMMISQGYFKQQQKFHDKDTNTCNPLFGFIYISTMAIYVHLYVICTGALLLATTSSHASSLVYHGELIKKSSRSYQSPVFGLPAPASPFSRGNQIGLNARQIL